MKVTMQMIAEAVGVSRGTVDRAIHHRGRIDPEVEERIFEAARSMGYALPGQAGGRPGKNDSKKEIRIGVVTYLCNAGFMREINRGIAQAREELRERGVTVILRESRAVDEKEQLAFLEELEQTGMDALAVMPIDTGAIRKKLYALSDKGIPLVMFYSKLSGIPRLSYVGMDNFQSGRAAAGLMNVLTAGSGRLLVITGSFGNQLINARVDGFTKEIKDSFPGLFVVAVQSSYDSAREVKRIIEADGYAIGNIDATIIAHSMRNIPGINGIFVVSSGQAGIRDAFAALNLERRPYVVIYDQTPKNEKLLRDDLADFLIDQSGFEQGYRPLHILANAVGRGILPDRKEEHTEISIRTKYNL